MGSHFYDWTLSFSYLVLSIVAKFIQVVKLDWNNGACFWVFNLEVAIGEWKLEPMVSVELWYQISLRINQCKLPSVSAKHALAYIELKLLLLSCFLQSVKKDVIDSPFATPDNSFFPVFIHVNRLVFKNDLFFKFKIRFTENKNFSFTRYIDVIRWADRTKHFNWFTLGTDTSYKS